MGVYLLLLRLLSVSFSLASFFSNSFHVCVCVFFFFGGEYVVSVLIFEFYLELVARMHRWHENKFPTILRNFRFYFYLFIIHRCLFVLTILCFLKNETEKKKKKGNAQIFSFSFKQGKLFFVSVDGFLFCLVFFSN